MKMFFFCEIEKKNEAIIKRVNPKTKSSFQLLCVAFKLISCFINLQTLNV